MASPGVCMLLLLVMTTVATDMELEEMSHSTAILDDTDTSVLDNADTTILDNTDTVIQDDGDTSILDEDNTTIVGDSATIMLSDTDTTFDDVLTSTNTSATSNVTTPAAPAIITSDSVPAAAANASTTDSSTLTTTKSTTTSTPTPNAETTTPITTINTPTASSSEAFTKSTEASAAPETASATPTADNATLTLAATNPTGHSCRQPGVEYPIGISYEELREALEVGNVLLIDVRNRWELEETGRLPWSVNLPLPELEQAIHMSENDFMKKYGFPKPLPEDTNVVLTCRSGRRATVAWKQLEPLGYCNIRVYFGSYLEWKARGGPLLPVARTL
ncbi:hypothetical protein OTU49_006520 [Cherax quadricarinatus]|uniref:Rhodanese domain-containing protein n=1 Tax=Cherax quadricarinatus TaxID=27406 RepID=A0AAW0X173_CHEQU|nr:uncharacterized protein LOC128699131 [Cherax quadricarinatus]